jgi:uncharacterized protein (TIGR03435 family)
MQPIVTLRRAPGARAGGIAALALFASWTAWGQPDAALPKFEVASVKQSDPALDVVDHRVPNLHANRGQLTFRNLQLRNLIMLAYGVGKGQLSIPNSFTAALANRYDVLAKLPAGATNEQVPLMLQNLLAERFKVTLHRENKIMPLYALVIAGNGSKLKEAPESGGESGVHPIVRHHPGSFSCR